MAVGEVVLRIDISKYKYVDLPVEDADKFLERISERIGRETSDIKEVIRYIRNFDEFYEYAKRKFKDYIAIPHRPDDYIRGTAVIDKVKLYKADDGSKRIVIVFDRRIPLDYIKNALEELGFNVIVKNEL